MPVLSSNFNPRSPHGERPRPLRPRFRRRRRFQSTLSSRRATNDPVARVGNGDISIHALLTESDSDGGGGVEGTGYFNPRSPHGERHIPFGGNGLEELFQSTLSSRRATCGVSISPFLRSDFNPRSPHGERLSYVLQMRGDRYFNPRSPHGERQFTKSMCTGLANISIHALLTESDARRPFADCMTGYFNPRSPHGERRCAGR